MYWRMQLHPAEPHKSVMHAINCLSADYIGPDFADDIGDLKRIKNRNELPDGQHNSWDFAHTMKTGDVVLIITHNFLFALARVAGSYNYIRKPDPCIGWFRHFRPVKDVIYYADCVTNTHSWQQIKMTDTFSPLNDKNSMSYRLIQEWLNTA